MSFPLICFADFIGATKAKTWQIAQYMSASLRLALLQKTTDGVKTKKTGRTALPDEEPGKKLYMVLVSVKLPQKAIKALSARIEITVPPVK